MAFKAPATQSLPAQLSDHSAVRVCPSNPLWAMTMGLQGFVAKYKPRVGGAGTRPAAEPPTDVYYAVSGLLAKGTFSQIYRATDLLQRNVAIKVVPESYALLGSREAAFLRHLKAKCGSGVSTFVDIYDAYRVEKRVCLVMPLYRRTLLDLLRLGEPPGDRAGKGLVLPRFSNQRPRVDGSDSAVDYHKLRRMAGHLGSALCVLKEEGVIHGDIKPENIFIESSRWPAGCVVGCNGYQPLLWANVPDDCVVKLGDFGSSLHVSEVLKFFKDFSIQSLPYRSPEVLLGVPFGVQIDMWSLGVVLAELGMGGPLFTAATPQDLYVQYSERLTEPSSQRFAGGRLYHSVNSKHLCSPSPPPMHLSPAAAIAKNGAVDFSRHIGVVNALFKDSPPPPPAFVHAVAGLLHPDPDRRLTATEYMQHGFISGNIGVPVCMLSVRQTQRLAEVNSSISSLRQVKRRRLVSGGTMTYGESKGSSPLPPSPIGPTGGDGIVDFS